MMSLVTMIFIYTQVRRHACVQAHLVDPTTGNVLGSEEDEKERGLVAFNDARGSQTEPLAFLPFEPGSRRRNSEIDCRMKPPSSPPRRSARSARFLGSLTIIVGPSRTPRCVG